MSGTVIAVCLTSIAIGSFVIFVAAACNVSHIADDYDEMLAREVDARVAALIRDDER